MNESVRAELGVVRAEEVSWEAGVFLEPSERTAAGWVALEALEGPVVVHRAGEDGVWVSRADLAAALRASAFGVQGMDIEELQEAEARLRAALQSAPKEESEDGE